MQKEELQGVILHLDSEVDNGATFYFTQTFSICKNSSVTGLKTLCQQPEKSKKSLDVIHILLVEDNSMNVFVAKSFLESWGATIDVAENGQEALDILDINQHKLVLMDLRMPVMNGYEATRIIREKGNAIPIIALTASLPGEVAEEVKGLGIEGTTTSCCNFRKFKKIKWD